MKLVISGDKHIRQESPYREAIANLFSWYAAQPFNTDDAIHIDLGDLYHRARPTPNEYHDGRSHLSKLRGQKKLMSGNHDFDHTDEKVYFSLQPHYEDPDIEIITDPQIRKFGNLTCLFLPWKYHFDGVSRKEYYEKHFPNTIDMDQSFDLIFYHFGDESIFFGGKSRGIDLSSYKGKRVGGDIHVTSSPNYLKVPIPTRKDEAGHSGEIMVVDCETKEIEYYSVPRYLDFFVIKYGEEPKTNPEGDCVHYIIDAPSFEAAEEKYSHLHLGGIQLKKFSIQNETQEIATEGSLDSLEALRETFFEEKRVDPEVRDSVRRAFSPSATI